MAENKNWQIFEHGVPINRVFASEEFIQVYTRDHPEWTYIEEPTPEPEPEPEPEPTELEQLRADVDYIAIMTGVEL